MTREEWLNLACKTLVPYVQEKTTNTIPEFYISVGFPKGHSGRQKAIGQCWSGTLSEDGKPHIFICPTLSDPIAILATVIHEIIHTAYPEAGHRADFAFMAKKCGLTKPWTATSPGLELKKYLEKLFTTLPEYEHAALTIPERGKKGSRMRRHVCNKCETIVYKGADEFKAICMEEIDGVECEGRFELKVKE